MKKIIIFITAAIIILLMAFTLIGNMQTGISLLSAFGVFFILFISYFYFEKNSMGTKEIAVIATLSAFIAVSRIIFAPIPNVKPVTFLVALTGLVFGPYEGFLVGSTSTFLSNIFFGQGPWTPWQMFSWGLIGVISGFMGKSGKKISVFRFSVVCFLFGFMFDWIMDLWYVISFVKPITIKGVMAAYVSGLNLDILHAGSSFIFSVIFYDKFLPVLKRYKNKLYVSYIK